MVTKLKRPDGLSEMIDIFHEWLPLDSPDSSVVVAVDKMNNIDVLCEVMKQLLNQNEASQSNHVNSSMLALSLAQAYKKGMRQVEKREPEAKSRSCSPERTDHNKNIR
ncbi:hypothetical protein RF11_15336 [Thelohanellus kitauei]|uniref:Uncharacterized protein n=1 Tax=Thelohanellus kitauei TaxID=669202 RepID=A0A0C2M7G0_THEKT|nr:hypothetical protein RF11_15336 [Thelohanellus kitauei]